MAKFRNLILGIALLLFASGVGYQLGLRQVRFERTSSNNLVVNQTPPPGTAIDFSMFWDVWQRLFRSYVDQSVLVPQKMVYGAISGMVNSLGDPYTLFLPPQENTDFKQDLGGAFQDIGAELGQKDGHIIIMAPLKDSPAEKAGLLPGDWIVKVDGVDTLGWSVATTVNKIRGPKGTQVTLNILHDKGMSPIDITITRDTITVPSVTWWEKSASEIPEISGVANLKTLESKSGKVAYLSLSRFGDRTNEEWDTAVSALLSVVKKDGGVKGLIFDLRNNPGGYLEGAVFIGSEFVRSGTIVSQVNGDGTRDNYTVDKVGRLLDIPLVVIVNKGSASAAEIVAGALRDNKRGTLVGETTFGKGSVQTPEDLSGGAGLHITTGKWYTPAGTTIDKKGITPDVPVTWDSPTATNDAQLAKALELLLK